MLKQLKQKQTFYAFFFKHINIVYRKWGPPKGLPPPDPGARGGLDPTLSTPKKRLT